MGESLPHIPLAGGRPRDGTFGAAYVSGGRGCRSAVFRGACASGTRKSVPHGPLAGAEPRDGTFGAGHVRGGRDRRSAACGGCRSWLTRRTLAEGRGVETHRRRR